MIVRDHQSSAPIYPSTDVHAGRRGIQSKGSQNSPDDDVYLELHSGETADIVRKYDLHNISQHEVRAMARELFAAGAISGEQVLDLQTPLFDEWAPGASTHLGTSLNKKIDFLDGLNARLETLKTSMPDNKASIAFLERVKHLADSLAASTESA